VIALALASTPFTVIKNLLDIQHDFPPHQSLDWNQVIREMAIIDVSTRYQSLPLLATHKTFYFLAKCAIAKRVKAIGVMNWRDTVNAMTERPLGRCKMHWFEGCDYRYRRLSNQSKQEFLKLNLDNYLLVWRK
jgi:hypothetical protein